MRIRVFVNGCFDVVHTGHLYLLSIARSLGTLYIGIDSDERVRASKGETRPIFKQDERRLLLENIKGVQSVYVFNNDEELTDLVRLVEPDYMLVGGEYKDKRVIGSEHAKEVIYIPKIESFSTTNIVSKIQTLKP